MPIGTVAPFRADAAGNAITIAATTSPSSGTLPASGGSSLLVLNGAAATAFVRLDGTATTNDLPIPAGQRVLIDCGPYASAVSAVLVSGSGPIYLTRGSGSQY